MAEQSEQTCRGTPTTCASANLEGPTWPFAECYKEAFGGLPPSQQREAFKRLSTRRRNPLSPEQCAEPSPEVLACLEAVHAAYMSKKLRSRAASSQKREAARVRPDNVTEPEAAPVEALADTVAEISLEPAIVVAEAEPAAPRPTPAPTPQKSLPIAIPKKVVLPAAVEPAAAEPAKVPATPAKKKGLAGRFA